MRAIAVVLAVCACGDNLPGGPGPRSGARLQLVAHEFADGTRHLVDELHDRARDERCVPVAWSDGFAYCAPVTLDGDRVVGATVYADPGCVSELGRVDGGEPPAYLVHRFWLGDLSSGQFYPSRLYARGDEVTPPAQTYELRDGACLGPEPVPRGARFFALGDELPVRELASIARTTRPTGQRLAVVVESSKDGMQRPVALVDEQLAMPCAIARRDDATAECVPPNAAAAVYFHDAACSEPELSVPSSEPLPDHASVFTVASDCTRYFERGTEVGSNPLYRDLAGTCTAFTAPSGERQFLLGAPLSLATIARTRDPLGDRLHAIELGDTTLAERALFDAALGVECTPAGVADGVRCVPDAAPVIAVFADAACTQPALVAEAQVARCDATLPAPRYGVRDGAFYELAGAAPTVYELTTGDRCVPYTPDVNRALFAVAAVAPLDRFAAASVVVVP